MSQLAQLQKDFQAYLLNRDQRMANQIIGTPKASAIERLDIYAEGYRLRLLEVLQSDYPALHTLLGDAAFDRLGREYIEAHPSDHPSLRWFGRHMAEYLKRNAPYAAQPVLAEMAAFEWAQGQVFDAEDEPIIGIEDVAAIPMEAWPEMRLTLHPSVRRLDLEWNVPTLWSAIEDDNDPPQHERGESPVAWLMWRNDFRTYWRSIPVDEAWAVDACQQEGHNFGELCEGLCEWVDESEAAMHAAGLLKRWVTDGLIARVDTP